MYTSDMILDKISEIVTGDMIVDKILGIITSTTEQ